MHGDPKIVEMLNEQLTAELTAINQYFLHAKLQEHKGFTKLSKWTYAESIEEMKHAEKLTERVLMLDGLPNYQRLGALRIGETVEEMFRADLAVELEAVERLRRGIPEMRAKGDAISAKLFEEILEDEEKHVDHIETQLELLNKMGEERYLGHIFELPES
jgi:bacterioferritin